MTPSDQQVRMDRISTRARMESIAASVPPQHPVQTELLAEDAEQPRSTNERRSRMRVPGGGEVSVRRIGGFPFQCAVRNISATGLCVELIEACEAGEDVVVRLPALEAIGANTRWSDGHSVGLEFARSMHPAVFDALLVRLS